MIRFDSTHALLPAHWQEAMAPRLAAAHASLLTDAAAGVTGTGWLRQPETMDLSLLNRVRAAARQIRDDSESLIVIGVGGSSLGARAALHFLQGPHHTLRHRPRIFFAGDTLDPAALTELLELAAAEDFSVNIVSKSGATLEPASVFRLFRALLEKKYGPGGAAKRIYATTDPEKGLLRTMARENGWTTFPVPSDIGGRYSVLTPVGLLPMAVAGADVAAVLAGAREEMETLLDRRSMENAAWGYAGARNALYESGRRAELLISTCPSFTAMTDWWKQLFGESEGKKNGGLFPAAASFPGELHSLGQFIQDGTPLLFETVVRVDRPLASLKLPAASGDGLDFLTGRELGEVTERILDGVLLAHTEGGVPNLLLRVPALDEASFGALVYFFCLSCALSGTLQGVNPFDQPGVEAYKRKVSELLGRPGF